MVGLPRKPSVKEWDWDMMLRGREHTDSGKEGSHPHWGHTHHAEILGPQLGEGEGWIAQS